MHKVSQWWASLFKLEKVGPIEFLLWLLLAIVVRHGLASVMEPERVLRSSPAFDAHVVSVEPVAWAIFLPPNLVLNPTFGRILGGIAILSAVAWAFKAWIPYTCLSTVASYGLLLSVRTSRNFSYVHEFMPTVALLVIIALYYLMYSREIRWLIREHRYWRSNSCPHWVFVLIVLYLATYYGYAGLNKIFRGGMQSFDGIYLQLLMCNGLKDNVFTRPILSSRTTASVLMTGTIILEIGAFVAFWSNWTRPWWALGLAGMHLGILLTMKIPFLPSLVILIWLALPWGPIIDAVQRWSSFRGSQASDAGVWVRRVQDVFWRFPNCDLFGIGASSPENTLDGKAN